MKIVCIDGNPENRLTKGKIYDVALFDGHMTLVRNDSGNMGYFFASRFISLEEYRNLKIDKLLK